MTEAAMRSTHGFLFADLRGYTGYVEAHGDAAAARLLTTYRALVRDVVSRHHGAEIRTEGDSFYVVFPSASSAVLCGLAISKAAAEASAVEGSPPISVGVGIHAGETADHSEGYIGSAVNIAARVCAQASPGDVLVTDTVRSLTRTVLPVRFVRRGTPALKGIAEPISLFRVEPAGEGAWGETVGARSSRPIDVRPSSSPRPVLRVVIADDEVLLREGLARLLAEAGFDVVGKTATAEELLRRVEVARPDVAIVDIKMPPTHTDEGLVAAQEIRRAYPEVGVLLLSHYLESRYAMRLLEQHPERVGYLLKERVSDVAVLADALRRIAEGESVLDPTIVARLVHRRRDPDPLADLTERELEVLSLIAEGRSNQGVGAALFLSPKTVESHIRQIFMKLDLEGALDDHRRVLAVLAYLRRRA
jgi:DNA-binding NarL/FixJ family response regulator/class 3 adenylate cyclase